MNIRREERIHKDILAYLRVTLPHGWRVIHCPNGGSRNVIEAAKLKAMGTTAGVPDLMILGPKGFTGWLEVKAPKGRLSQAQRHFIDSLQDMEHPVAIVHSIDEAREIVRAWGLPSKDAAVNDNADTWISLGEAVGNVLKNIGRGD